MVEEKEVFDLDWEGFVDQVFLWGGMPDRWNTDSFTWPILMGVLVSLANIVWVLGQRVKKLEEKE